MIPLVWQVCTRPLHCNGVDWLTLSLLPVLAAWVRALMRSGTQCLDQSEWTCLTAHCTPKEPPLLHLSLYMCLALSVSPSLSLSRPLSLLHFLSVSILAFVPFFPSFHSLFGPLLQSV